MAVKRMGLPRNFCLAKANELAIAGKHDASTKVTKTFVHCRCQYVQLLPNAPAMQPLKQVHNDHERLLTTQQQQRNQQLWESSEGEEVKLNVKRYCLYSIICVQKLVDCEIGKQQ